MDLPSTLLIFARRDPTEVIARSIPSSFRIWDRSKGNGGGDVRLMCLGPARVGCGDRS